MLADKGTMMVVRDATKDTYITQNIMMSAFSTEPTIDIHNSTIILYTL